MEINQQVSAPQVPNPQIQNFTPIQPAEQRFTTRDFAPVRERPYNDGVVWFSTPHAGSVVMVNGYGTNTRNNRWYSTVDGGWIYSGNLSTVNPNSPQQPHVPPFPHSVSLRETANQTTGITNTTIFNFRASTNFDATRVVIAFSGGGSFNMNRTNSRDWFFETRLTVPGAQTITVHAYEGNVRRASHSMQVSTSHQPQPPPPAENGTATIQYRANGGIGAPHSHTVRLDNQGVARFNLATALPARTGYVFLGWRLDNDTAFGIDSPGQQIAIGLNPNRNETLTYFAQWQRN